MIRLPLMGLVFACAVSMTSCGTKSRQASGNSDTAAVAVSRGAKRNRVLRGDPPPSRYSRLRQRLCGETSAGECASGGHTRPSKRRGEYLSVCFGSEGYEACRYSCRLYRDRNSGEACYLHDFPATLQLYPVGCLRLCGGHYQYPPSFQ